jgi:hypothetical protein
MSDDDFVFGDEEDESLFGSSETTANDSERRFGTSNGTDSSTARRTLDGVTKTTATVVLAAVLVVAAGAVAYPLVMSAFDSGPTEGRAPSDGDGSAGVSTTATSTDPPVTQIVVTIEETATERPKSTTRKASVKPTATTPTMTESPATTPSTSRTTVPVNEFPAGDPADENETAEA